MKLLGKELTSAEVALLQPEPASAHVLRNFSLVVRGTTMILAVLATAHNTGLWAFAMLYTIGTIGAMIVMTGLQTIIHTGIVPLNMKTSILSIANQAIDSGTGYEPFYHYITTVVYTSIMFISFMTAGWNALAMMSIIMGIVSFILRVQLAYATRAVLNHELGPRYEIHP